ncbi:cation diffusion facilitator family transporter [Candidatus Saccharibacteria bacterium]|nr:cation diffusion facilitator family transporter [Candidatus Saccharibacteria bacterium]
MIIGVLSNSIAITSDAVHSLADSISGFIIIISEKLSQKKNNHQRRNQIERIATIIIALIIIVSGIHIIIESIEKIILNESVEYSIFTYIVIIASIIVKYALAKYLKNTGKSINSTVLNASGAETLNDTWISISVLVSIIIYSIWQINIESYISIVIAIVIISIGLEFIFPHISKHHHHHLESNTDHTIHN